MKKTILLLLFSLQILCSWGQTLYIFGGEEHDVYLGKLNANEYDLESIWNEYGTYGSKYSQYSSFNRYANYPPVIVDINGNFYGYLTVNKYKNNRAEFDIVNAIYKFYEYIRDDVSKWYSKLFD